MQPLNRLPLVCLLAALALLQGCVTTRYETGRSIDESKVDRIQKGETTSANILEWFGAPTTTSSLAEHVLYVYKHCQTGGSAFSVGYYTSGSTREQCDELSVTFDKATGKVVAHSFQRGLPR